MNEERVFRLGNVTLHNQDVAHLYERWPSPDVIISDGGYGVSGFKGDAREPSGLPSWYRHHVESWSLHSTPGTTLWFWNTEVGWAIVHPILEEYGWHYVSCNIWNKGIQHIAGNCNLPILKNFPIVTEVCAQYVRRAEFPVNGKVLSLKQWLRYEWERTGLPLYKANEACGVANAATRKYLTKDHVWYAPPPDVFNQLVAYANEHGDANGKPFFSLDGQKPTTQAQYANLFARFEGQYGITNVWEHPPLHNGERVKIPGSSKYAHLNQKPLKLIKLIIEVSSAPGDVIWEPFGGLCTAGLAAYMSDRVAHCAEINPNIFTLAVNRLQDYDDQAKLQPKLLENNVALGEL